MCGYIWWICPKSSCRFSSLMLYWYHFANVQYVTQPDDKYMNHKWITCIVVTQNSYSFINFGSYIICMAFRTFMKFLNCLITISCSWGKCFYWKLFDPLHGASRPTLATAAIFNTIPVVHCTVYQWNATWNCIFCSAQNSFFFFQKGSGRWQNGMTIREPFIYVLAEFVR